jgi:DNA-binding NarL/FixJ family response regulator
MVAERVRDRLTPKELKILGLILQGYKNKDIAEELKNSEQVIKNYLRSIFDKTGVSDRLELALFTMHHKILANAASRANDHKVSAPAPSLVN